MLFDIFALNREKKSHSKPITTWHQETQKMLAFGNNPIDLKKQKPWVEKVILTIQRGEKNITKEQYYCGKSEFG
jgi:hypothetical protein